MRKLFTCLVIVCCGASIIWAQATAQIHGTVQDESGAAIPGATVKATQTETGISRTVDSEADGNYVITNLPLGPYQIEVNKQGFAPVLQTGIVLQVNSNPAVPITVKVGAVSERVTVEANASQVETASVGVGSVIENQRVLDLPLNGRQPTDLIALGGAAVQTGVSPGYGMRTGIKIAVAGGMADGVQYNLDGANHANFFDGTSMILPFPDALQEFKLTTSTQDASNSGRSGATVDAVMKSGSNAFHGDVFEFLRNTDANARDFFSRASDGLKRNQFGGTVGGPIKKDKLFFFAGYQGTFVRQTPLANTAFVPTPDMLGIGSAPGVSNFQPWVNAGCGAPLNKGGYTNSQAPLTALSPAAIAISSRLPAATNPCGLVSYAVPLSEDDHEGDMRVDYQLSDKQSLFVRNMLVKQEIAVPYPSLTNNVLAAGGVGADDQFDGFTLGDTYLISGTKVNAVRVYLNRISAIIPGAKMFGPSDVGIGCNRTGNPGCANPLYYSYQPNYLTIPITGGFSLGSGNYSENSFAYTTAFGLNDDFRIVHGAHQFSFGGSVTRSIEWSVAQAFSGGYFSISGQATGTGLADFLMGDVSLFRNANPNPLNLSQPFANLYAMDTWKINNKLTATFGVTWDPFFGMAFQQGDLYNFSLAGYYAKASSKVVSGAPSGFTFPGDSGFPGKSGINAQYGHFDPRFGLAWDPFGDGKTAIRLGAGMAHDFIEQDLNLNTSSSLPFRLAVQNNNISLDNPYPSGDPFPYSYNPKNPVWPVASCMTSTPVSCPPNFLPVPPNMHTHVQYTWNLGVQRQITTNWFLSTTYVGTHILHIWNAVELNPAVYFAGNCAAGGTLPNGAPDGLLAAGPCTSSANIAYRRVLNMANPSALPLGNLTQYDDGGTQSYNGLLINSSYRLRNGLSLTGNYTWSHCIGLAPVTTVLNPGQNYVDQGYGQNVYPVNRDLAQGNCIQDRRQVANFTLVYQTPKYSNRAGRLLGSGWTLASTIQARSGAPLNIVTNVNPDPATGFGANAGGSQRPNQLLSNVYATSTDHGVGEGAQGQPCTNSAFCVSWLNPLAFTAPIIGTAGNLGAYVVTGPAFWQWDMAVSRAFSITEGSHLDLRVESFNITNSLRLGNPGLTVGTSSTFGVITTDATPPAGVTNGSSTNAPARVMQFALKYVF